jgi:hypothetical protein
MENKFTLSYKEEQSGMVASAFAFIYKWIKNFDGAEIELSDTFLKITPLEKPNNSREEFPLLTSLHKKVEPEFVKTGSLTSELILKETNIHTTSYIGQFSNGWKFRFIIQTGAFGLLENGYGLDLEKSVCIAEDRDGGWAIYFNLHKSINR